MAGRNHPIPAHQRAALAGAMPAEPGIAEVEQEPLGPAAVLVEHNGPLTVHQLPARRAATMSLSAPVAPGLKVLGAEIKRSRVILCSVDKPFYYAVRQSQIATASSAASAAAIWPANVPLPLHHADQVWVASADASLPATIGVVIETWAD